MSNSGTTPSPDVPQTASSDVIGYAASTSDFGSFIADLRASDRSSEALQAIDGRVSPVTPWLYQSLRANVLNDLGRYEEACAAARQALSVEPAETDGLFALGFALYMLERWPEAEQALAALVAIDCGYPNGSWLRAGLLNRWRGSLHPEVLSAYNAAIAADPANYYLLIERGDVLRACGRHADALSDFTEVRDACSGEPLYLEATFKFACVAMVMGDAHTARLAFRTVLDHAPEYPEALEMYALLDSYNDDAV